MKEKIRVTVWNEFLHEKKNTEIAEIYPEGIHGAIAEYLNQKPDIEARTATLEEPQHGLTDETLNNTDVLIWWGHMAHDKVSDAVVEKVYQKIMCDGIGLIVLHSAHYSKIFRRLMGTSCSLRWREDGKKERLWVVSPGHPITKGLGDYFEIEQTEMYGEFFDIPRPDELVFISWFKGGEVFRSGCCFYRGRGKIFYFRPGHETYPIYHDKTVLQVIENAVRWAAPVNRPKTLTIPKAVHVEPLEDLT
ncbi:trehalose utilization protein ThuA [Candidatus Bathyarchaeota archaeon]|nr:MAG: trehalose utilization protein ThuA [Candidatus Bathyarchaeota archaeon]